MHGSDTLTVLNAVFSVADFFMVCWLVINLRERLRGAFDGACVSMERSHVHALVGVVSLFLYGSLGIVTAVGAVVTNGSASDGVVFFVQLIAVGLRVAIFILLAGWTAFAAECYLRGRWPRVDRFIERLLRPMNH